MSPKAIYRVNTIPIKIPMAFFIDLEEIILKFVQNHKRSQITKANLKENKAESITFPVFNYYKAIVIKTVSIGIKNRHVD